MTVDELADEVCMAVGFRPNEGEMVLNRRERAVSYNITDAKLSEKDKSYYYAVFSNRTIYSCELNGEFGNNDNVDLCTDLHPEKARLSFYAVLLNGVRVVFTKTVAFSTILTIRAVLF